MRFISVPAGAKAYLNGELVGITPVTVQDLTEARYAFEIRLAGYKSYVGKINLSRGRDIAVERELEKLVEIEEMLGGQLIPRKPTDPATATRRALLPGVVLQRLRIHRHRHGRVPAGGITVLDAGRLIER